MKNIDNKTAISLSGAFILLGIAFGIDQWVTNLEIQSRTSLDDPRYIWFVMSLGRLGIMISCLFLFSMMTCNNRPKRFTSLVLLSLGTFILFYNLIAFYVSFVSFSSKMNPDKLLFMVGAFIAATGIFNLYFNKERISEN